LICSFNFLIFLAVCLNISTAINIKILTNSNQQTQSYKFTSHIAAFLSVDLITEMLEICIQISYDQNFQLILKSYLPVVCGTTLNIDRWCWCTFVVAMPLLVVVLCLLLCVCCCLFMCMCVRYCIMNIVAVIVVVV
jgi:hypothetical protein